MAATLPADQRLLSISPKAYEHPADRAATAALHSIPGLDAVVRKLIEYGYERALRQQLQASSIRLGDDQLPKVWSQHKAALARLDLDGVPDLYLTQFPIANAAAIGAGRPVVLVNSATVSLLDEPELRTVFGHEAAHILSDHVLYKTALLILIMLSQMGRMPFMLGLPLMGVQLALLEWSRAAELSCDRAATLVNQDPLVTCRTLMVIAGGASSRKLSLDAFIRQASEYNDREWGFDKLARLRGELGHSHGHPVRRVSELMKWVQAGDYDRIVRGDFMRRGEEPPAREEASEARDHYVERFRGLMKDAGAGMDKASERVAGTAEKLSDWLRTGRS